MNWLNNLCSCISPQLKTSIIDYLNSSNLNSQVIQQQKCTEQDRQFQTDPKDHVYALAKSKSFNFMKLEEKSDDEDDSYEKKRRIMKQQEDQEEQEVNQELMDVFWYPVKQKGTLWEHYKDIFKHKSKLFSIILEEQQASSTYDKVYDSQDQTNLIIYCRLESLIKGKKINSYRFSFNIPNFDFQQFKQWEKQLNQKQILPLLDSNELLQTDPNDPSFSLRNRHFKKLLVISPHQFLTVQKSVKIQSEQKNCFTYISFSVKPQSQKLIKNNNEKERYSSQGQGWLHLFGIQVTSTEKCLHFKGYMSLQLQVSISPSMLKQPISKQIRVCVQKLICSLKKSDQI